MRITSRRTVLLLALALMLWSPPGRTQQTVDLVILHVNDSHGALSPHLNADSIEVGGAARAATLIREIRKQHSGRVLVLHAGDLFSRGEPITACSGGLANLEILERMGVDDLTPGNGEFYFGVESLVEQTSRVNFPVLHANVVHRHTGTPLLPAYTIKEISGVRVAILGLGVVRMGHYSARDLEWLQPIEVAKRYGPGQGLGYRGSRAHPQPDVLWR